MENMNINVLKAVAYLIIDFCLVLIMTCGLYRPESVLTVYMNM